MSNSRKKVIVRRFTGDTLPGYLPLSSIVRGRTSVDLLDLEGRIVPLSLGDIKTVSYVREFNLGDTVNPERLFRRTFLARPRNEGLWVRVTFRTGEALEGLAATPPDPPTNTQHIFAPRTAIAELQLPAVITPRKPLAPPKQKAPQPVVQ